MDSTKASDEDSANLLADQFLQAVADLDDLATIHTNPEVNRLKTEVMKHTYKHSAVADGLARALEVWGIAKAAFSLFPGEPHHTPARYALRWTGFVTLDAEAQFCRYGPTLASGTDASAPGTDRDAFRAFLRARLSWVHEYGTLADGAPDATSACLSPATAYLQFIVRATPVEHWAAALSPTTKPNASPLSFALALARRSPGVGKETADVALLVSMGSRIVGRMSEEREACKKERERLAEPSVVQRWFSGLASLVYGAPADLQNHQSEPDPGDELLETMSNLGGLLQQEGDRYAQLLGSNGEAEERASIVDSIRRRVLAIFDKADPPVCDTLIKAVGGLAAGDE